jgi:hypothetical protein
MRRALFLLLLTPSLFPPAAPAQQAMAPEVVVSATDCAGYHPRVAFNSLREEYLVVWTEYCPGATPLSRIRARRFDFHGLSRGPSFDVSPTTDGRDRWDPAVAHDPIADRYLVVYDYDYDGAGTDIDVRARFLGGEGVVPSWPEFAISQATYREELPDVAVSETTGVFLVSWTQAAASDPGLRGARVTFGSNPAPIDLASGGPPGRSAALAFSPWLGEEFAVGYDNSEDLLIRWVDPVTGSLTPEQTVASNPAVEGEAAVASCGDGQTLVAWEWLYGWEDWDLGARFFRGDAPESGTFALASSIISELSAATDCRRGGASYLVAWQEWLGPGEAGISARQVTTTHQFQPPFAVRTGTLGAPPGLAGGRAGWFVAWMHPREGTSLPWDLHGRVVWELFADGFEWGTAGTWSAKVP